jgi:hypothetical protein
MVVGAPQPGKGQMGIMSTDDDDDEITIPSPPPVQEETGGSVTGDTEDDYFDLDKYRQAAGVAYEFSKKKMEDAGEQERATIGKGGQEQRATDAQKQRFREREESRDYQQAQRGYSF